MQTRESGVNLERESGLTWLSALKAAPEEPLEPPAPGMRVALSTEVDMDAVGLKFIAPHMMDALATRNHDFLFLATRKT